MKDILKNINKVFDNRIRLGVMSALMINESVDFNELKKLMNLTDGNLASHIKTLEASQYILSVKQFIRKKPNTKYEITELGKIEFKKHINALEQLINP